MNTDFKPVKGPGKNPNTKKIIVVVHTGWSPGMIIGENYERFAFNFFGNSHSVGDEFLLGQDVASHLRLRLRSVEEKRYRRMLVHYHGVFEVVNQSAGFDSGLLVDGTELVFADTAPIVLDKTKPDDVVSETPVCGIEPLDLDPNIPYKLYLSPGKTKHIKSVRFPEGVEVRPIGITVGHGEGVFYIIDGESFGEAGKIYYMDVIDYQANLLRSVEKKSEGYPINNVFTPSSIDKATIKIDLANVEGALEELIKSICNPYLTSSNGVLEEKRFCWTISDNRVFGGGHCYLIYKFFYKEEVLFSAEVKYLKNNFSVADRAKAKTSFISQTISWLFRQGVHAELNKNAAK